MFKDQNRLIQKLFQDKLISPSQRQQLIKESSQTKKSFEELVLAKKIIDEEKLTKVKGELLNISYIDLSGEIIVSETLRLISKEVAENYQIIAFKEIDRELYVGLVDPQNFKAIEAIEFLTREVALKPKIFIISFSSFKKAFRQYQILTQEVSEVLEEAEEVLPKSLIPKTERPAEMEEIVKSAPVSKIVLVIIKHAVDGRASDIHIEPSLSDTRVRYRIDGILRVSLVLPKYIHSAIIARIKVLANLKLDETRRPQDGRMRLNFEGRDIDFRISTLPLLEGEKVVLRILDTSAEAPTLQELGFNRFHIEVIKKSLTTPHGLILLTGPTGSGKTTTLYSILSTLNQEGINIITLEDPIEYFIDGINQSQINPKIGYTFANGLRSILRQDPNIIMLGEIRDIESAELVIHAALTGHLVLSTLHTNDALGVIPRLFDMGIEPFLLATTLNLVTAQRLVRKICPYCKVQISLPPDLEKQFREEIKQISQKYLKNIKISYPLVFWKGQGCSQCANLGYLGRYLVAELINITEEIRDIISQRGKISDLAEEIKKQEFITLRQDSLVKALKGITSIDEVIRISQF